MRDKKKKALKIIIPVAAGYLVLMAVIACLVVRLRTGQGVIDLIRSSVSITADQKPEEVAGNDQGDDDINGTGSDISEDVDEEDAALPEEKSLKKRPKMTPMRTITDKTGHLWTKTVSLKLHPASAKSA